MKITGESTDFIAELVGITKGNLMQALHRDICSMEEKLTTKTNKTLYGLLGGKYLIEYKMREIKVLPDLCAE